METDMINAFKTTAIGLGIAGTLAVAAATPSFARAAPYNGYTNNGYTNYAGPYGDYAYVGARGYRGWANEDIPVCYPSLRWQNRC
jgi:hypothetical protein